MSASAGIKPRHKTVVSSNGTIVERHAHFTAASTATLTFNAIDSTVEWIDSSHPGEMVSAYGSMNCPITSFDYRKGTLEIDVWGLTSRCPILQVARLVAAHGFEPNFVLLRKFTTAEAFTEWETFSKVLSGDHPDIILVGYGSNRLVEFMPNAKPDYRLTENIGGGSALVMRGNSQHLWKYRIPPMGMIHGDLITMAFMQIDP